MHKSLRTILLARVLLLAVVPILAGGQKDQFTPVLVSTLTPTNGVFRGTDGKQHVVYELEFLNANATPATLQKIEVLDEKDASHVVATYQGAQLVAQLRTLSRTPVANAEIEFNGARMLLLHLVFEEGATVPQRLLHRISLLGGAMPAPTPQTPEALRYTVATVGLKTKVPAIGPPLKGKGWVALNGCCELSGAHRGSSQSVNGGLYFAQRFAIDWMRLDDKGHLVNGNEADVHSYTDYGADVIAVADGKVVGTMKDLDDQKPGALPAISTITLENVDGNHVVLDLGNGVYAFYAHLQRDSIPVFVGDHVKRGQLLGKLGNTGNTSAPHLHFHLMDSPSTLASNGLPYVIDSFAFEGAVPAAKFEKSENLNGAWNEGLLSRASARRDEYPMDFAVITFSPN
jgi:Peptidase family M23